MRIEFKKRLVIKGDKGQELNRRETKLINEGTIERFLPYVVVPKKDSYVLEYETIGKVSLAKLLKTSVLSKRMFLILLDNLYEAMKEAEVNVLSRQLIMLDPEYVIVDPSTWHVYMMYIPLQFYETKGNLMKLLLKIVQLATFDQQEDTSYVQEYLHILDSRAAFSALSLENYIARLKEEVSGNSVVKPKCPKCKANVEPDETVCPTCGYVLVKKKEEVKEAPKWRRDDREKYNLEVMSRVVEKKIPYLKNVVSQEQILISGFPFRIGKYGDNLDYVIPNSMISRNHVEIVYEQGVYYAVDLNSSNGTFLNGRRLQCGFKESLTDGAFLRLADIEFEFHIG